ncbi:MAG: hypothetical protein GY940_41505 [bacterium]|nr:hypothetical protein [bacterium]
MKKGDRQPDQNPVSSHIQGSIQWERIDKKGFQPTLSRAFPGSIRRINLEL